MPSVDSSVVQWKGHGLWGGPGAGVIYSPAEQLTSLSLVFCIYNSKSFTLPQCQDQGEANKDFVLDEKIPRAIKNSVIKKILF